MLNLKDMRYMAARLSSQPHFSVEKRLFYVGICFHGRLLRSAEQGVWLVHVALKCGVLVLRGWRDPCNVKALVSELLLMNTGVVPPTAAEREDMQRRRRMGHTEVDDEAAEDVAQQFSELLS